MRTKYFDHEKHFDSIELVSEELDGERYYTLPTGERYKSVTTILSALNKKSIMEWRKRVGPEQAQKITTQASTRGTKLHAIVEKYINNEEDFHVKYNPSTIDLFKSIQPIIDERVEKVYGQEFPLYSHLLKTAGRCDLFCRFDGMNTVVDFKSSSKLKREDWIENYFLQCTVYAVMIQELYNINVPRIAVVIGVENEQPQVFVKKTTSFYPRVKEVFCK
jgi:genome maintenance exonuclease 1